MSKDYERGFGAGFEAGFKAAEKLQREKMPVYAPQPYPFTYRNQDASRCSVCGFTFEHGKIYGYVCGNAKCPSKATSGPMTSTTGAVGSDYKIDYPTGAVGSAGPYNER